MTDRIRIPDQRTVMAVACLIGLAALVVQRMWSAFPPDLSALYMAGWLYAQGNFDLIYAAPPGFFGASPPEWQGFLPGLGLQGQDVLPYVYPPFWAALLSPAAALDPATFFRAAAVAQMAMLAASVALAWRLARGFAVPIWGWILISIALIATSFIAYIAIAQLQPQITVTFLTLLAFDRYGAGKSATAGTILAVAAALKLAPAALALIFLLDRDRRAACAFAVAGAALAGASLAFAGPQLHWDFLASMKAASAGLYITAVTYSSEVMLQAAASLTGLAPPMDFAQRNIRIDDTGLVVAALNKFLLLAALVWMLRRTDGLAPDRRLPVRLFALWLLISLFGPLGWIHYYLLQLLLLPMLIGLLRRPHGVAALVSIAVLTSWPLFAALRALTPGDLPPALLGVATMTALFVLVVRPARGMHRARPSPLPA